MHELLRPKLKEMTKALHLLAKPKHWVKGQYATFSMSPSKIKHSDSDACRSLLFFCHKHIHSQEELRCVATEHHTTQIIIKPPGGCTPWHHDGPTGTIKTVENDKGEKKQVIDYDRPSYKQLCVQKNEYCRTITAIGITDHQKISSLFLESDARVVGDDGVRGKKMKIVYERKAGETITMGPFANGMRVGLLLQPEARAASGNRLTTIRFKHCTGHTLEKEVTTVVDAATKAPPLLELMTLAQKDAAEALVEKTVQPPYSPGSPNLQTLAGSFLPGQDTRELTPEEQVHILRADQEKRKKHNEKAKEKRDGRTEEQKIADNEKAKEKRDGRPEEQKIEDNQRRKEKYNSRPEKQKIDYSEKQKEKYNSRSEKQKTEDSEKRKEKRKSRPEKQKKQREEANQQNKKQRKEAPAKKQREKKPTTTTTTTTTTSSSGRKSQRPARYYE
jgi:hypothetical protein